MKPLLKALEELALAIPEDQPLVLVMDRWFCGKNLSNSSKVSAGTLSLGLHMTVG